MMTSFSDCCRTFAVLSRSAAKAASSKLRQIGVGKTSVDWVERATACETCPLRTIHNKVSYCGSPLLDKINRDEAAEGCGCPCRGKARLPDEHCPIDRRHQPAVRQAGVCTCKWCNLGTPRLQ